MIIITEMVARPCVMMSFVCSEKARINSNLMKMWRYTNN
jgi:hypothetical protein